MTDLTALSLDAINNALDYCHETLAIESDYEAHAADLDADWAREEALRQMAEDRKTERDFEAQIVDGTPYSIGELRRAFSLVANTEHWKYPVDAKVSGCLQDVLRSAIPFMTGSQPTFEDLGGGWVRVRADGYFAAVGA